MVYCVMAADGVRLVLVVSSSLPVEDGFLFIADKSLTWKMVFFFITDKSFDLSVGHMC